LDINPHCKNFNDLPDIKISLKTRTDYKNSNKDSYQLTEIILRPEDYLLNGKKIKKMMKNNSKNSGDDLFDEALNLNRLECKAAFMSINVPEPRGPILIFGEQFMKKFYTVFDRDERVLGFSIANQNNLNSKKTQSDLIKNIITPYDNNGNINNNNLFNNSFNYPNNNSNNNSDYNQGYNNSNNNNGKISNFRFENFLEQKIFDKTFSTSKIRFKERNTLRNYSNNNNNKNSNQGKDDVLFVHP
jgi:hypothetical protein